MSNFTVSSDGQGGTRIVDPTAALVSPPLPWRPFIAAMAGFGPAAAGSAASAAGDWGEARPALAAPRAQIA